MKLICFFLLMLCQAVIMNQIYNNEASFITVEETVTNRLSQVKLYSINPNNREEDNNKPMDCQYEIDKVLSLTCGEKKSTISFLEYIELI
jgi:hypothetical protein